MVWVSGSPAGIVWISAAARIDRRGKSGDERVKKLPGLQGDEGGPILFIRHSAGPALPALRARGAEYFAIAGNE